MIKICIDEARDPNVDKWNKMRFVIQKNLFFLLLFYDCSYGSAFQRWLVKLEKGTPITFLIIQNGKFWKRSTKVLVIANVRWQVSLP